ncbi:hypothetical protein L8V83_00955 [Campylobacter lari]|nr:hypothetical protein [Campylobacter lari]MCV3397844.1 hypothetical protein [Campylobacter lari]
MRRMIRGERADYSASLYEVKGTSIIYKENGAFIDILKGIYPDHIALKIINHEKSKKLNKGFNLGGFVGKTLPNRKAI